MLDRRRPDLKNLTEVEDALFSSKPLQNVLLALTPDVRLNNRRDVVIMGRVGTKAEVPVLFIGRRAKMVGPLHAQLNKVALNAPRTPEGQIAAELPVLIQGIWRAKTIRNEEGWENKSYHLLAAAWSIYVGGKLQKFHGEVPAQAVLAPDID